MVENTTSTVMVSDTQWKTSTATSVNTTEYSSALTQSILLYTQSLLTDIQGGARYGHGAVWAPKTENYPKSRMSPTLWNGSD